MKDFFTDFRATSQDILEYVGQEVALKDVGKDSKSMFCEYRDRFMLKMNAARTFCKVNDLSTQWKESNWVAVGVAHSEEEANQKAERLKSMVISEKEHMSATGESLYLNLGQVS